MKHFFKNYKFQKIILTLLFLHIALSHQEEDVGAKESVVDDADGGVKDDEAVGAKDDDGRVRVKVPVKRLHSRHRRYIAPGARWDVLVGWETLTETFDIHSYIQVRYYMDYLFGGQTAYNALIAANNAGNAAWVATKAAVLAGQTVPSTVTGLPQVGTTGLPGGTPTGLSPGKRKRRNAPDELPCKVEDNVNNILVRSLADDQVEILQRIEEALNRTGLNGRQCVLRAICELRETPIHEASLLGETITLLFMPKKDNHTKLDEYKRAEQIGLENGDCWSFFPECSHSIFNFIPGIHGDGDEVSYIFDKFETGSKVSKDDFSGEEFNDVFADLRTNNDPNLKPIINS